MKTILLVYFYVAFGSLYAQRSPLDTNHRNINFTGPFSLVFTNQDIYTNGFSYSGSYTFDQLGKLYLAVGTKLKQYYHSANAESEHIAIFFLLEWRKHLTQQQYITFRMSPFGYQYRISSKGDVPDDFTGCPLGPSYRNLFFTGDLGYHVSLRWFDIGLVVGYDSFETIDAGISFNFKL